MLESQEELEGSKKKETPGNQSGSFLAASKTKKILFFLLLNPKLVCPPTGPHSWARPHADGPAWPGSLEGKAEVH